MNLGSLQASRHDHTFMKYSGDWGLTNIAADDKDLAGKTARAIQNYKYLQCNLKTNIDMHLPPNLEALCAWREFYLTEEWGGQHAESIQDWPHATLLLFGRKGIGTRAHVDWSSALNIAFAWTKVRMLSFSMTFSTIHL